MTTLDPATTRRPGGPAQENFPVAVRILPRTVRTRLQAIYRYARYVDDVGDAAPGDRVALLQAIGAAVHDLYAGRPVLDPVVAGLAATVHDCAMPSAPLLDLVAANVHDQQVSRYADFDELLDYCRLSAEPIGALVLHVFDAATPDRLIVSGRICTGLQLVEHWQDVAEDFAAGRVYLPQEDLRRFGVEERELAGRLAGERLRALLAFETDRASAYLDAGAALVSSLSGWRLRWARLAVSGYLAGGRAAVARLRAADYDPLPAPPKPTGRDILTAWLTAIVRYPG